MGSQADWVSQFLGECAPAWELNANLRHGWKPKQTSKDARSRRLLIAHGRTSPIVELDSRGASALITVAAKASSMPTAARPIQPAWCTP